MQSHVPKIQTINNVIRKMTSVNIYYMYMYNSIMIEIACFETDLKTNYRKPDQQRIPKIRESREKSIQCIDHVQLHQTETSTTYW